MITRNRLTQAGFTLLELMVVLLILGVLAGVAAPKFFGQGEKARVVRAKTDIKAIETALELYRSDNGQYPTAEQGLKALVEKPTVEPVPKNWNGKGYLRKKKIPVDPWGRTYEYKNPGTREEVDVYSLGKNKDSEEDDIGNWSL